MRTKEALRSGISDFNFLEIKMIGGYMIDPEKKGEIDLNSVAFYLNRLFPEKQSSGLLCIDLENSLYYDIRNKSVNTKECEFAIAKFIELIAFVKLHYPNIKLGIYGIPFTVYYDSQLMRNEKQKLDKLLVEVDVLFPSFYIYYPAKQKGLYSNYMYLKKNLDIAFEYSERLNKPLIPFFWYLVHSSNEIYKFAMLPKKEVDLYIDYLFRYKSASGKKIDGIVWWDTPTPFIKNSVNSSLLQDKRSKFRCIDEVFKFYLM